MKNNRERNQRICSKIWRINSLQEGKLLMKRRKNKLKYSVSFNLNFLVNRKHRESLWKRIDKRNKTYLYKNNNLNLFKKKQKPIEKLLKLLERNINIKSKKSMIQSMSIKMKNKIYWIQFAPMSQILNSIKLLLKCCLKKMKFFN